MAVVFGLVLGSVMTGAVIYRNGVSCQVEARSPGLSLLADGRDTGIAHAAFGRRRPVVVKVRLRPGRHTLSLPRCRTLRLQVARGAVCQASFTDPPSQAAASPPAAPELDPAR